MEQDDQDNREALLKRDGMLIGIAAFSLLNGMHFSPFFDRVTLEVGPILAGFFVTSPLLLFYFTSLLLSVTTLLLGGVPAALFERFTGRKESDMVSLTIWLVTTAILALPSLLRIA